MPEFVDAAMASASATLGFSPDQLWYLLCYALALPLAAVHRALPSARHALSIAGGVLFLYLAVGTDMVHCIAVTVAGYVLMRAMPRRPIVAFVLAMGYLSAGHIYRMYTDYLGWTLDWTAPQMMITIKLTMVAMNVHDGYKSDADMSPYQRAHCMRTAPTFVEYLSHILFFPQILAGPTMEIRDYLDYVYGTGLHAPGTETGNTVGRVVPAAGLLFLQSIAAAVGFQLAVHYLPIGMVGTAAFDALPSLLHKYLFVSCAISGTRFKYYFGWYLAESACVLCGVSYSGVDAAGRPQWDRARAVRYTRVEFATNFKMAIENWNMGTQVWLRHYVYSRLRTEHRFLASFTTWVTSAFWHGFYPGYYTTFTFAAVLGVAAQVLRRRVRPFFVDSSHKPPRPRRPVVVMVLYTAVCMVLTTPVAINHSALAFMTLEVAPAWHGWCSMYFLVHVITIAIIALDAVLPPTRKPAHSKPKAQ